MKRKKTIIFFCSILLIGIYGFHHKPEVSLNLRFTKNYEGDSWKNTRTGFIWALSFLGADLPKGSFDKSIEWNGDSSFNLNFNGIGFNENALQALNIICDSLKKTEEYQAKNSIDLGEFIVITLGSSWHYYRVTGVANNLKEFKKIYDFSEAETFPVIHSSVAKHNRILRLNFNDEVLKQAYIAEEGSGEFLHGKFRTAAFEAFDIMPNGQLRFAIYNREGNLIAASPQQYSAAGKPAKCLWCHEINIQPLFLPTDTLKGYITPAQFQKRVDHQMRLLNRYRATLNSDIDFVRTQDHTFTEHLYTSYMEPSLKRLSQEWNMPEETLKKILSFNTTHVHEEFKQFGELFSRDDVSEKSPYKPIQTPLNVREENEREPDFFK
jgi:hypothetical protein